MSLTNSAPAEVARTAAIAARRLAILPTNARDEALIAVHEALAVSRDDILRANARDLEKAIKAAEDGKLSQSVLKRLDLGRKGKYEDMLRGILDVRELEDPIGNMTLRTRLDEGLELQRISCPIGVLLIIFEARPEVIANITSLAIKSGNAAILKGGKESTESFIAIANVIARALESTQVPNASIQLATRDAIPELLKQDKHIDLVIPRGSNELVSFVKNNTSIPVLGHADGICTTYIHASADPEMAVRVIVDAKTHYPAACNSVEQVLVDEAILESKLPLVAEALLSKGVSLVCDKPSRLALETKLPKPLAALLQDAEEPTAYETEYLDLKLALKTIPTTSPSFQTNGQTNSTADGVDLAIDHINTFSSHHTDAILTSDEAVAKRFLAGVDSASVYWNTSTRMADGMRYGFGTEVGISTNKIHARGPVGLEGLMIYKYQIRGEGQTAGEYHEGPGGRKWVHQKLSLS